MVREDHIVKVEEYPLDSGACRSSDELIVNQLLVGWHLARIQEPDRSDGPGLQISEDGICIDDAIDELIQIG